MTSFSAMSVANTSSRYCCTSATGPRDVSVRIDFTSSQLMSPGGFVESKI